MMERKVRRGCLQCSNSVFVKVILFIDAQLSEFFTTAETLRRNELKQVFLFEHCSFKICLQG